MLIFRYHTQFLGSYSRGKKQRPGGGKQTLRDIRRVHRFLIDSHQTAGILKANDRWKHRRWVWKCVRQCLHA
jgi:hypothetical protein